MALVTDGERAAWFESARNVSLTNAHKAFLDLIQPWVEAAVYQVIGYPLEQAEYTEFLPSTGGERPPLEFGIDVGWDRIGGVVMPRSRMDPSFGLIQLSRLPVRSVTSVYENLGAWVTGAADGDWPASSLLPATAYRLDFSEPGLCKNGRLIRIVGSWPTSPRTVKATYTAGYTAEEIGTTYGQVKLAALEALAWWWGKAMRRSATVKSNFLMAMNLTIRDFSATFGDPSMLGNQPGNWAVSVLGPESLNILLAFVNFSRFLGG